MAWGATPFLFLVAALWGGCSRGLSAAVWGTVEPACPPPPLLALVVRVCHSMLVGGMGCAGLASRCLHEGLASSLPLPCPTPTCDPFWVIGPMPSIPMHTAVVPLRIGDICLCFAEPSLDGCSLAAARVPRM